MNPRLLVRLVAAANELHRRRLWKRWPVDTPVLLRVAETPDVLVATAIGHVGQTYGLIVQRSPTAWWQFLELLDGVAPAEHDMLVVTMEPWASLDEVARRYLQPATGTPRREQVVPVPGSKLPGEPTRLMGSEDGRVVLACLRLVLAADDEGLLRPRELISPRSKVLQLSAGERGAGVSVRFVPQPQGPPMRASREASGAGDPQAPVLEWIPRHGLPEDDDLEAWKALERLVIARWVRPALEESGPRARSRFFGGEAEAREALSLVEQREGVLGGFAEWYFFDFRATARARTRAEKVLARKDLTEVERYVLQAKQNARLGYYRVDACEPGSTLTVEDVVTGERLVVHDRALSGCGLEGFFVPLRLAELGCWLFPTITGPVYGAHDARHVLKAISRLEASLASKAPRKDATTFGRLWWMERELRSRVPVVQNTDGDPIEPITATFHVENSRGLAAALDARPDTSGDEDSVWTWFREGGHAPGFGSSTTLARIELIGDEALVDVNSQRRLERVREWMDRIPGVRYVRQRVHEIPTGRDAGPPEREPPPSAEVVEAIRSQLESRYVATLDEPVPMFGGRTLRELARTPDGRSEAERWIRLLPPIRLPGGDTLSPPRERLRRELGL